MTAPPPKKKRITKTKFTVMILNRETRVTRRLEFAQNQLFGENANLVIHSTRIDWYQKN